MANSLGKSIGAFKKALFEKAKASLKVNQCDAMLIANMLSIGQIPYFEKSIIKSEMKALVNQNIDIMRANIKMNNLIIRESILGFFENIPHSNSFKREGIYLSQKSNYVMQD